MTKAAARPEVGTQEFADSLAAFVGYHYRVDDYYEIGREKVREYARAVQDLHPVHHDETAAAQLGYHGLMAPLTFISLVGTLAQRRLFETVVYGYDLSQVMQTDQVLEFHQPILSGDQLTCDVSLDSFRQMAGTDIIVTKNIVTNQRNELVQTTWTSLVGRSGGTVDGDVKSIVDQVLMHGTMGSKADQVDEGYAIDDSALNKPDDGPVHPDPILVDFVSSPVVKLADVAVGDELPVRHVRLTRGDLVNYAGVAGDANPIHWSDELAAHIGLETCVAHGMLTMGLGAGFITSWLGDPGAVRDYSVRFVSPVYVSNTEAADVEFSGKIKSIDPELKQAVIALTAMSGKRRIFGRATATVDLA